MIIYLATPYSDPDPRVIWERYRAACKYSAYALMNGELIYSPIVYCHQLAVQYGLNGDWAMWKTFDEAFIAKCSELRVLKLEGWVDSIGVNAEIDIANRLNIPVTYVEEL